MFRNFVKRIGLIAMVGLAWWWLSRNRKENITQQVQLEITVPVLETDDLESEDLSTIDLTESSEEITSKAGQSIPTKPDDLKRLFGIGPKVSEVFQSIGISTFSQLSKMDSSQIQKILEEAQVPLVRFETWPAQAQLAAAGDWEGLEQFIEEYKTQNS